MREGTNRTRPLEFETTERTAVFYPIFVRLHNLETFAVSTKDCYCHYVSVADFPRNQDSSRSLRVPYLRCLRTVSSTFRDSAQ